MELKNYTKRYGDKSLFENFSLSFDQGGITVLLGNSGIGKTTLLNALAGLDNNYGGQVDVEDKCAYIFQEPRLLKGVSVFKNVELALPKPDADKVNSILKEVELEEYSSYTPSQLSGGMAQRVSLARAFVCERRILLMDEPFGGLDCGLKYRLFGVFRRLWQKTRPTTVIITHDLEEATELADHIVVLKGSPVQAVLELKTKDMDKYALRERLLECLI